MVERIYFEVSVNVSSTPPNQVYDFASNSCDGSWQSNARFGRNVGKIVLGNTSSLSCNGRRDNPIGFVFKDGDPDTEAGVISSPKPLDCTAQG